MEQTDRSPLAVERASSCSTYFENYISRFLFRERLVGFFEDIDVSGLGVRDSFYGGWELGHGRAENVESRARDLKLQAYIGE